MGEVALEQFLGIDIVDWSIGDSSIYNVPDLGKHSLDIGVKTVEYGKFPVIHKNVVRPEIINIRTLYNKILICGLATKDCLRKYQDDDLILSPSLRRKGTKTGFYGFNELKTFKNLEELTSLLL